MLQQREPTHDHIDAIRGVGDEASWRAVIGFLRYEDLTPATDILNRPGIIALKGIERRAKDAPVNPADWRKHIDRDRATRTARGIK